MNGEREWVSVEAAARHFNIRRKHLYGLIARQLLPPGSVVRLGHFIRLNIVKIEAGRKRPGGSN